jgi:UDP-2,4-diacetamido-2,4,6-trideoxy-beta-L-altropyranose hydrolase
MKVFFRVDASLQIGTGHVIRCLNLATALQSRGDEVCFICREHKGNLIDKIEKEGFQVNKLPSGGGNFMAPVSTNTGFLGASWEEDAQQTREAIKKNTIHADWLIIDHYAIDARWERALRKSVPRLMVIDDLADRDHECNILLDQNEFSNLGERYNSKVPRDCNLLLGAKYVILHPLYAELHTKLRETTRSVRRILIYFGGADTLNLTGATLRAFLSLNRNDIELDVVLPLLSNHLQEIQSSAANRSNIHFHFALPSLAELMARADLSIGAGGTTIWERICLRLPSIVVTLADNQHLLSEQLHERKIIEWLGTADKVKESDIADLIDEVVSHPDNLRIPPEDMVDGKGVGRIINAIRASV